jgi:DNA-3-methyladenine glycosylase
MRRLEREFFQQDVLEVAPKLLGLVLGFKDKSGLVQRALITETEAYRGEEDLACHARFGRTGRTEVMYGPAGRLYVYLIYGLYWMLNIVTGKVGEPQAVLIRGLDGLDDSGMELRGPGRVGRWLGLDKSFYGEEVFLSQRLWLERPADDAGGRASLRARKRYAKPRIGVEYAGEWAKKPWRFGLAGIIEAGTGDKGGSQEG